MLYCRGLVRREIKREPGDTLAFYGSMAPRREQFLRSLNEVVVKTKYLYGLYGEEWDRNRVPLVPAQTRPRRYLRASALLLSATDPLPAARKAVSAYLGQAKR